MTAATAATAATAKAVVTLMSRSATAVSCRLVITLGDQKPERAGYQPRVTAGWRCRDHGARDPEGCEVVDAGLLVMGLTSLVRSGKPVANQVTTHPDPCRQRRTQPDTACGLTCGYQTSWDPGRRNQSAWHARGLGFESP